MWTGSLLLEMFECLLYYRLPLKIHILLRTPLSGPDRFSQSSTYLQDMPADCEKRPVSQRMRSRDE